MITGRVRLIHDGKVTLFEDIDDAAMYMEWVNSGNPDFPNFQGNYELTDEQGRGIYLHAEFGAVVNAYLL